MKDSAAVAPMDDLRSVCKAVDQQENLMALLLAFIFVPFDNCFLIRSIFPNCFTIPVTKKCLMRPSYLTYFRAQAGGASHRWHTMARSHGVMADVSMTAVSSRRPRR